MAVVIVTTLDDSFNFNDGLISLREAIFATNLVSGADTIQFAPSLTAGGPAKILLTQGELKITDALTIDGPGANLLTIDASGNDPTPDVNNGDGSRVFNIDDGNSGNLVDVAISGLTLTGGDTGSGVAGSGGAIRSLENLAVTNCSISGNSSSGNNPFTSRGGGVYSQFGTLLVTGSTISGNSARSGGGAIFSGGNATVEESTISGNSATGSGGAIFASGNLTVDHSIITGNTTTVGGNSGGAGIYSRSASSVPNSLTVCDSSITNNAAVNGEGGGIRKLFGSLVIERAVISGNMALGPGGGVSAANGGVNVQIDNSTISGNSSGSLFFGGGGLLFFEATTLITSSTISGNTAAARGGGVYSYHGPLTVVGSTISGNSAYERGGGVYSQFGTLSVTGSTISGNSANEGGGLFMNGTTTVRDSTIAFNTTTGIGKGIFVNNGSLSLNDSIVAQNTGLNGDINGLLGTTISAQFSLVGNNQGSGLAPAPVGAPDANGNLIGTSSAIINSRLGPLAYKGGPTFLDGSKMLTQLPLAGSPAINAGDPAAEAGVGSVPASDQRGAPFMRTFGGRIDIGAIEVEPAVFLAGDYNRDGVVDTADYTLWRDTTGNNVAFATGADGNGDGVVNMLDYSLWQTNFGQTLPMIGSGSASEPGGTTADSIRVALAEPIATSVTIQSTVDSDSRSAPAVVMTQRLPPSSLRDDNPLTWLAIADNLPCHANTTAVSVASDQSPDAEAPVSSFAAIDESFAVFDRVGRGSNTISRSTQWVRAFGLRR